MNVDRLVAKALSIVEDRHRQAFAADPVAVLQASLGLTVRSVPQLSARRDDGGACDGMSFLDDGVILYAPTPNSRRANFTLAHELGHWLIDQLDDAYDWLADQTDPPRLLETVCDRIAADLLLPPSLIDSAIAARPLRAQHVLDLYERSNASRPACAIAVARRLPSFGAVVIIDSAQAEVSFASIQPDAEQGWPAVIPWRGQQVPPGHPLRSVTSVSPFTGRIMWRTRWGYQQHYYTDAVGEGNRVIAVFCDADEWGSEHLHIDPAREYDQRPVADLTCCGQTTAVRGYPCPDCGQPYCPRCGLCRCQKAALREQRCDNCTLQYQP
ncbi:MAG TPA: ImmA/IrrE family metallo-endopeptidase, partial [Mycobacterium sp.]